MVDYAGKDSGKKRGTHKNIMAAHLREFLQEQIIIIIIIIRLYLILIWVTSSFSMTVILIISINGKQLSTLLELIKIDFIGYISLIFLLFQHTFLQVSAIDKHYTLNTCLVTIHLYSNLQLLLNSYGSFLVLTEVTDKS